jgi:hypothetical protein
MFKHALDTAKAALGPEYSYTKLFKNLKFVRMQYTRSSIISLRYNTNSICLRIGFNINK